MGKAGPKTKDFREAVLKNTLGLGYKDDVENNHIWDCIEIM